MAIGSLLITTLLVSILHLSTASEYPVVMLSRNGKVRGKYLPGYRVEQYEAFMGIPYAKPPINELRFANPVLADPIIGTYNATMPRADCIQKNYLLPVPVISGEEDCLYLNVYRPLGASTDKPLPVMVYIYGGGFFSGTANPFITGPAYFMDSQKVILVTMAYRLGALGFLSTGDETAPGNYALKDQSLALRWIHKYIRKFGGRNDAITIFGQSAGGASVHMQMLNQQSTNYFQRAIVMSGNAAAPYNDLITDPLKQARKQAEYVGIRNAKRMSPNELISALRRISALDIVESGDKFKYWHVDPLTTFRPVLEKNWPGAFVTRDQKDIIRSGHYNQIPWMLTFVPYEGAVRALSIAGNETLMKEFNENFDELLIKLMEIPYQTRGQRNRYVKKLVDQYMNGERRLTKETMQGLGNMITGRAFIQPMNFTIEQYLKYGQMHKNPLFLSKFNYRGNYSYSNLFSGNLENYGVVHCDDLVYLLKSPALMFTLEKGSVDAKVSEAVVGSFVSFATEGNLKDVPLPSCSKKYSLCDYQEIRNSNKSTNFEVITSNKFDEVEMAFWNNLIHY